MNRKGKIVTIIIFLVMLLSVSGVSAIKRDKKFSVQENRYLTQKPEWHVNSILNGKYEENYQEYLEDQFIFRNPLMNLYTNSKKVLFNQDVNNVFLGKDGYLIEKHDWKKFESKQAEQNNKELAEFIYHYSDLYRSLYVIMIPTAEAVLSNKLPAYATTYNEKEAIDKMYNKIGQDHGIDVLSVLNQHKDEYIYYKTDHHYTTLGAYYAYRQWIDKLKMSPNSLNDFTVRELTDQFYGTIQSKLNYESGADMIYACQLKSAVEFSVCYNNSPQSSNTLYNLDALETKDKYSVFLGGNNALLEINTSNKNGRKLLVIKDSFAHCFIPFLINQFETIDVIDLRYYNYSVKERLVENEYSDILILYGLANFCTDGNIYKFNN